MARTYTCDLCGSVIPSERDIIGVMVRDGLHPHNGSIMNKTIDVCTLCATRIRGLRVNEELDFLQLQVQEASQ